MHEIFSNFFDNFEDISIVLIGSEDGEGEAEMVYSLQENRSFFRGRPPCDEISVSAFLKEIGCLLPRDYLSFLRIHNGFGKLSELGILQVDQIPETKKHLLDKIFRSERILTSGKQAVDPEAFIPFYESFGLDSYQGFFADWYPGSEMGNVYLSGIDYTISDYMDRKGWAEHLAFPTFLEWLAFYLEGNNLD